MNGQDKIVDPLKVIANSERVAIITFIAPEKAIRVSPAGYSSVEISTNDAYELERKIDDNKTGTDRCFVLLHSPGGSLASSYNIARFLRNRFKFLHFFVPYEAASGATLMSLSGNLITLGELGYLTPIDPQVLHDGKWVSSYGMVEQVGSLERKFKNMRPEEMPIPWKQMVEKIDIITYREMDTNIWEAQSYAEKLLKLAGYEDKLARAISRSLSRNIYSHGHCLDRQECEGIGLQIDNTEKSMRYLGELKKLIHTVNQQEPTTMGHEIRITIPDDKRSDVVREKARPGGISGRKARKTPNRRS